MQKGKDKSCHKYVHIKILLFAIVQISQDLNVLILKKKFFTKVHKVKLYLRRKNVEVNTLMIRFE